MTPNIGPLMPDDCTCPCVFEGRGWPDPQPAEYEPSETCVLHGLGAPFTAFSVAEPVGFPDEGYPF